jgi:hypothetical protein
MKNTHKFLSALQNAHNFLTIKDLTSMGGGGGKIMPVSN